MLELVSGFLERFELALVVGWGAIYFALTALFAYTVQAISDKTEAAPAWMSWVPFVQMHPIIRASGSTWTALLIWIASLIAVTVFGAVASSSGSGGGAQFAAVLLILGSLIYFGQMMWRLAENRELSGYVGLACLIPLFGLPFYFYIAFHDGLVRPNPVGLGVVFVLSIGAAVGLRGDLSEVRAMLDSNAALFQSGGSESSEEAQLLFESMQAAAGAGSQQGQDAALLGIASLGPDSAKRVYYQFTDEKGSVRFVEQLDQVPDSWRDRVGYVEMDGPWPLRARAHPRYCFITQSGVGIAARHARNSIAAVFPSRCCDRRGVSFQMLNIENPATLDELVEKTGQRGIPVLDVGGKILIGYDLEGLDRLLGSAS